MKQLTALLLLLLGSATVLFGQSFSFGATCPMIAPVVTDTRFGDGSGLNVWGRSHFGDGSGMDIRLGWQEIGDYQSGIDLRYTWVFPGGTQRQRIQADLESLRLFHLDFSFWRQARGGESRFAYELGARYSFGIFGAGTYEDSRNLFASNITSSNSGLDEAVLRGMTQVSFSVAASKSRRGTSWRLKPIRGCSINGKTSPEWKGPLSLSPPFPWD